MSRRRIVSLLGVAALSSLLLIPAGSTPALAVDGGGTIVTGSATGSSHVRRFNSAAAAQDGGGFFAFNHLNLKGVNVATGDVNGDGKQDIVVGDGGNGDPNNIAAAGDVRVLNANGTEITHLSPYGTTWGGAVTVAVSDLDGDGKDEVITGAGAGGGPHVKAYHWTGSGLAEIASFFAYDAAFHGGVFVAGGDGEIITAPGAGGGPHVKLFSPNDAGVLTLDAQFFAYDSRFLGGVRVSTGDFNNDGLDDIVTGPGPGGGPDVRTFQFESTGTPDTHFLAYDAAFVGGVYVAGLGRAWHRRRSDRHGCRLRRRPAREDPQRLRHGDGQLLRLRRQVLRRGDRGGCAQPGHRLAAHADDHHHEADHHDEAQHHHHVEHEHHVDDAGLTTTLEQRPQRVRRRQLIRTYQILDGGMSTFTTVLPAVHFARASARLAAQIGPLTRSLVAKNPVPKPKTRPSRATTAAVAAPAWRQCCNA